MQSDLGKKYYQIRDRDTCQSIVGSNGITFAQLSVLTLKIK